MAPMVFVAHPDDVSSNRNFYVIFVKVSLAAEDGSHTVSKVILDKTGYYGQYQGTKLVS